MTECFSLSASFSTTPSGVVLPEPSIFLLSSVPYKVFLVFSAFSAPLR
jgi:hypothetical protein